MCGVKTLRFAFPFREILWALICDGSCDRLALLQDMAVVESGASTSAIVRYAHLSIWFPLHLEANGLMPDFKSDKASCSRNSNNTGGSVLYDVASVIIRLKASGGR